jgi:hypothetical protein
MSQNCSIVVTTPQGRQTFEGDAWSVYAVLVSGQVGKVLLSQIEACGADLDRSAEQMLRMYKACFSKDGDGRPKRLLSRAASAGVELDIVRCYLRGMTGAAAIKWLREQAGFKTSSSAIGRYWSAFRSLGIPPMPGYKTG